jgi:hypothetical protein
LIELESIEQLVELTILLILCELDIVLLQAVQSEFRVVDVNLHGVLHKLFAHRAHLLGECRGKHHHLHTFREAGREERLILDI